MTSGTEWFTAQHQRIREGFDGWSALRRMEALDDLLDDLARLRDAEVHELYPLAIATGAADAATVERCRDDHARMARIADHVRQTRGPDLVDAVRLLCEVFVGHADFEQTAVLVPVEVHADASQLGDLAAAVGRRLGPETDAVPEAGTGT